MVEFFYDEANCKRTFIPSLPFLYLSENTFPMIRLYALALLTFGIVVPALAQQGPRAIPRAAVINSSGIDNSYNPVVRPVELPKPISGSRLDIIKDSLAQRYPAQNASAQNNRQQPTQATASVSAPYLNRNFGGNNFNNSTPNDNEIAISDSGKIISVQNSNLYRYNTATNTTMGSWGLTSLFGPLGITATKYDPKVIYDPEANRFIVACLAGFSSNSTHILLAFSTSDSVNGSWNLYDIPGNPYNDTIWTDYPMMSVNHQELFVTVNLLRDNSSWQLGFVETLIWQINKWDGYNGDSLNLQMHNNIAYGNRKVRNLCPVEGGSFPQQTRDQWFVSDRNLDPSNDTIFLVHLTDTINAPGQQITVTPLIAPVKYFMPVNARQNDPNNENLATNDARILGAFMENDRIQFVGNTLDTATGHPAIYNGVITNVSSSPTLNTYILSDTLLEFGYPNIAYAGYGPTDNTAIIMVLHSSANGFPGYSAFTTDGNGAFSPRLNIKNGAGYIDVLNGDERWGDYTGIQRKYDLGGTVWVNGMYGLSSHTHATWIAEIGVSPDVAVPQVSTPVAEQQLYPNPFQDRIELVFTQHTTQQVRFVLYDMQGRVVEILLEDKIRAGRMQLSFSPASLASGVYLLRAEAADGTVLFSERLVRE